MIALKGSAADVDEVSTEGVSVLDFSRLKR